MSEPIKEGDLVMMIRAHCQSDPSLGRIFVVEERYQGGARCEICKELWRMKDGFGLNQEDCAERHWLKKIPPLEELEGEKRDEKLTEPA